MASEMGIGNGTELVFASDFRGNLSRDDSFDDVDGDFFEYIYDAENRLTKVIYDPGTGTTADMA